jgi:hypothetical protein
LTQKGAISVRLPLHERPDRVIGPDLHLDVVLEVPELVTLVAAGPCSTRKPVAVHDTGKLLNPVDLAVIRLTRDVDPELGE